MGKLFGTDGIRGIVGETLDRRHWLFMWGRQWLPVLTEEKGEQAHHYHRQGHPYLLGYAGGGADGGHLLCGR